MPDAELAGLLDESQLAAALTCAKPGADPPTAGQLASVRARKGHRHLPTS
jgi:hypothetical protein